MFCSLAEPPRRAQLHSSAISGYGTSVSNLPPQPPDYCANTAVDFPAVPPANVTEQHLLRSSLLVDIRDLRGESWRVRASDPIGSVQARTVPITPLEWMGWWPTRHRPIARAWNELVPKVLKNRKCLDTYELLNKSARFNFRHDGALGMLEGSCGKARLIAS